MAFGLGPDGFKRARYSDLVSQMRQSAKDLFGENVRTEPPSFIGITTAIFAWFLAQLWAVSERVFNSGFVDTAEGNSLAKLGKTYVGITPDPAVKAKGEATFTGDEGTLIEEGFEIETEDEIQFETTEEGEIEAGGSVTLDIQAVVAGEEGNVPANTITEIVNPIEGLDSVTNANETTDGRDRETDTEFRERYDASIATGGGSTADAIRANLLSVEGVRDAIVQVNDTEEIVDGIPPKSIAPFVHEGQNEDIWNAIKEIKADGIRSDGDVETTLEDDSGNNLTIAFTRPDEITIYADATLTTDEDFPTDGQAQVKANIENYIEGLGLGDNVIFTYIIYEIHKVAGITDVELYIDTTELPAAQDNIVIADREVAIIGDVIVNA